MIKKHIVPLFLRLLQLEKRIEAERKRVAPDHFLLLRLKKLRLQLKDKIARIIAPAPTPAYALASTKGRKR